MGCKTLLTCTILVDRDVRVRVRACVRACVCVCRVYSLFNKIFKLIFFCCLTMPFIKSPAVFQACGNGLNTPLQIVNFRKTVRDEAFAYCDTLSSSWI